MNRKIFTLMLGLTLLPGLSLAAQKYEIDPQHTGVAFRVRHMMISKVSGHFDKFAGTIGYEKGNSKAWSVEAKIDAASINTGIDARDKHLRSSDFLEVEKFPEISFKSTRVVAGKGDTAKLYGDLTIHGVTKPVILALSVGGTAKDPWGNVRLGATATTKISRKDFGLTWNKAVETGGVMVGDELEISLDVEAIAVVPAKKG